MAQDSECGVRRRAYSRHAIRLHRQAKQVLCRGRDRWKLGSEGRRLLGASHCSSVCNVSPEEQGLQELQRRLTRLAFDLKTYGQEPDSLPSNQDNMGTGGMSSLTGGGMNGFGAGAGLPPPPPQAGGWGNDMGTAAGGWGAPGSSGGGMPNSGWPDRQQPGWASPQPGWNM